MENITAADIVARIAELEAEAAEVRRMAQRADELADEDLEDWGEQIIRSEADNLWWVVGEIHDRIERMHLTLTALAAQRDLVGAFKR